MKLDEVKKYSLGVANTPIQKLKNVSKDLGVNLYIKRDDLNGLGLGGNKLRKLNYLAEDAIRNGCNVLLTFGGVQTNHGRMTAAVAAKLGLKSCIIMTGTPPQKATGNLILDKMLNAELVFMDNSSFKDAPDAVNKMDTLREKTIEAVVNSYKKNGDKVYIIPVGGSSPLGALGYVEAINEIDVQINEMNINLDFMITAYGSIGTYGGLLVGSKMKKHKYKLIGMNVLHNFKNNPHLMGEHIDYINEISSTYELGVNVTQEDIWIEKDTIRNGYNIPDPLTQERVLYLASREAIFLDFCYTGKAFSGLVDLIKQGKIPTDSNIMFIHTGGIPGVFSDIHVDAMQEKLWSDNHKVFTL